MDVEIEKLEIKAAVKKEQTEVLENSHLSERDIVLLIEKIVERKIKEMMNP